jgi:hypothetical protein
MSLLGELLSFCNMREKVTCSCFDVDGHVVSRLGRFLEPFGRVVEQSQAGEKVVYSLVERQREFSCRS